MFSLTEGELEFKFDGAVSARKFDGPDHGLSHCMRAVDFIVELAGRYLFVEVKDLQDSGVREDRKDEWKRQFTSGKLDQALKYKYRDTFLYEWGSGRADKPIVYVVLLAFDSLDPGMLVTRQDQLNRILPTLGPGSKPWARSFVGGCVVFNIETWNATFLDFPVRRVVASG